MKKNAKNSPAIPAISIIIPVYNAAEFLGTCLNSVVAALEGIRGEIILVNNGSTDNSLEIAQNFIKNHQGKALALSMVECQTKGAAAARNLGVKNAHGDYLWFIDADDTINKDSIQKLLSVAKGQNPDLIMLGVERIYPKNAKNTDGKRDYLPAIPASAPDFKSKFVRYGLGPWQVVIRRAWWAERNFHFKEKIIHEDMELMSALVLYTDNFASIDESLYFYRQTPGSVLHQGTWDRKSLDIFPALESLYQRFATVDAAGRPIKPVKTAQAKIASAATTYHAELEWFFIWNLLLDSAQDFVKAPKNERKKAFQKTRQTLKNYFPRWRRNQFFREKPFKTRLRILLNYHK